VLGRGLHFHERIVEMTKCKECVFYGEEKSYVRQTKQLMSLFRCDYGSGCWHGDLTVCSLFRKKEKVKHD